MDPPPNEWTQAATKEGHVSIGTHSLFLTAAGPSQTPSQPAVVIEAGHGDHSDSWKAGMRAISTFARVYSYDRAGYGQSEPSPVPGTARNSASELSALLGAAGVPGPYILVCHSYGGIIAREFVAANLERSAGLVLVDTLTEDALKAEYPFEALNAVQGSLDQSETTGVSQSSKLTAEESKALRHATAQPSYKATADKEFGEIFTSLAELGSKKQFDTCAFGEMPVSVIKGCAYRDYEMIYAAGVKAGNGTTEQREQYRKFTDSLDGLSETNQRRQLQLSKRGRMVYALESGHQVHMQQPELIADEVKWILSAR